MIIQCERIWLFEWDGVDPFIFNKTDGVEIVMSEEDDRNIDTISIDKAVFFINTILKGGIKRTIEYGGEDFMPFQINGKQRFQYNVEFNVPLEFTRNIEQLTGREYSLVAMRRNLSFFAIFGRFTANTIEIDNEIQQRLTLVCELGNYPVFELNTLNVTEVVNIIGDEPPIYSPPEPDQISLDYEMDIELN